MEEERTYVCDLKGKTITYHLYLSLHKICWIIYIIFFFLVLDNR
uniref:Uncharacterized protein n=1 Tax=Rhizophora mucronata TaxID=61149 RepID=A0A2P2N5Y5_RHIMU